MWRAILTVILAGCATAALGPSDSTDDSDVPIAQPCEPEFSSWNVGSPDLPEPREGMAAALVDGELWLIGGWTPDSDLQASTLILRGGAWVDGPALPVARQHLVALPLHDGLIVASGDDGDPRAQAWQLVDGAWVEVDALPEARTFAAGASDGTHAWIVGGLSASNTAMTSVSRWQDGAWVEDRALPAPRWGLRSVVLEDRLVVLGGAVAADSAEDTVWSASIGADGSLGAWQEEPALPAPRMLHGVLEVDGSLVLSGGLGAGFTPSAAAWVRHADGTHSPLPDLPGTRFSHASHRSGDHVQVIGGWEDFQAGVWGDVLTADACGG